MTNPSTKADFDKIDLELNPGAFSSYDQECIYPALIDSTKDDVYLEVGVDKGKSLSFARKFFKGDVFGVDLREDPEVPKTNFIRKESNEAVKSWTLPIKVLFIDGDHTYEGCKDDWSNFSPFVESGGWVFFHDTDATSPGVEKVFDEIEWPEKHKSPNQRCSMAWVRKP